MNSGEFRERAGALAIKILDALEASKQLPAYAVDGLHDIAHHLHYAEVLVQATDLAANHRLVLPREQLDEMLVLAEDDQDIDLLKNHKDLSTAADA